MRGRRWLKRAVTVGVAALAAIAVSIAVAATQAEASQTSDDGGVSQQSTGWS
jgi:negative regulator of sigma E activity